MAWAPNPPNFYKQFTTENLTRLEDLQKKSNDPNASQSLLNRPPELRYLVPPAPPAEDGDYRLFGIPRTTRDYLAPLEQWDVENLAPYSTSDGDEAANGEWTHSRNSHLKSLTRSIMMSFLEMVGMLSERPEEARRKQVQIKTLYMNALWVVNEYRPHQGRESLILRMEEEIEKGRAEVRAVRELRERVEAMVRDHDVVMGVGGGVHGHVNGLNGVSGAEEKSDGEESRDAEVQSAIWDVLNREFPRQQSSG